MSVRTEIDKAIRLGKDIEIEYVKFDGTPSKRRVSDISICNDYGAYGYENEHISGFCHLRGEGRHFKIDRIQSIRVLPDGPVVRNTKILGAISNSSSSHVSTRTSYVPKSTSSYSSSSGSSSSGGCYIATMVYGDYDHAKVMVLRRYRDNYLMKYLWGRCFVRIYYWLSPKAVRILHNKKHINNLIRTILNRFVDKLRKLDN